MTDIWRAFWRELNTPSRFTADPVGAFDWTQVADAPVDKAAWATYRQALRDITSQVSFPDSITWPTEPQ